MKERNGEREEEKSEGGQSPVREKRDAGTQ